MDNITNRFFVLDDADVPDEVRAELESYRLDSPVTPSPETRGIVEDSVISVLGGLVSAGIWDQLPLWASWWSSVNPTLRRASAEDVATNVAALCVRAGLATNKSEVSIEQLVKVSQQGWSGRASVDATVVSFRTDNRGEIIMFDTVSTGMPRS